MGGLVRAISGAKKERPFVFVPSPAPVEDAVEITSQDSSARRRRSRLGTIATSARGILRPGSFSINRKSLLGE